MSNDLPAKFINFLSRLQKVTEHKPGTWSACCPCHEDDKPSLSINLGRNGNMVVSCHSAGNHCSAEQITKAVGLNMGTLFATDKPGFGAPRAEARRKPSNVYQYQYEDGRLAYETLRYSEPKDFSQRRPNPEWRPGSAAPRYIYNLDGVRLVPYRLPRLLKEWERQPDRWTALVEGEKCSDCLESLGILATTHPLGADHWKREYAGYFKGRRVAIFYDLDPFHDKTKKRPGIAWAVQAARDLLAEGAACVRVCRPPECADDSKEDVADFVLAALRRKDKPEAIKRRLAEVITGTPDYYPGWENDDGFASLVFRHAQALGEIGEASMNDAIERVQRRLDAALQGVRLDSLADDLAEVVAWCRWLAVGMRPDLKRVNLRLGPTPAKISESTPAQPLEEPRATQEAAPAQDAHEALCLPAQAQAVQPEDDGEPVPC